MGTYTEKQTVVLLVSESQEAGVIIAATKALSQFALTKGASLGRYL